MWSATKPVRVHHTPRHPRPGLRSPNQAADPRDCRDPAQPCGFISGKRGEGTPHGRVGAPLTCLHSPPSVLCSSMPQATRHCTGCKCSQQEPRKHRREGPLLTEQRSCGPFSVPLSPPVAQTQARSWEAHGVGQLEPQTSFQRTQEGSPGAQKSGSAHGEGPHL